MADAAAARLMASLSRLSVPPPDIVETQPMSSIYEAQLPRAGLRNIPIRCGGCEAINLKGEKVQNTFCPGSKCFLKEPHSPSWPSPGFHSELSANRASEANRSIHMLQGLHPGMWANLYPNSGSTYKNDVLISTPLFNQTMHNAAAKGGDLVGVVNALTGLAVTAKPQAGSKSPKNKRRN